MAKHPNACLATYRTSQDQEQSGHLREARETLQACAKPACGVPTMNRCSAQYAQLSAEIPTIVPLVTDASGQPRVDVQVKSDGELLTSRLDGQALAVDPGLHEFTFAVDGVVFSTQKILIVQGQRNRQLSISYRGADKSASSKALVASTEAKSAPDKSSERAPEKVAEVAAPAPEKAPAEEEKVHETTTTEAVLPVEAKKGGRSILPYIIGSTGLAAVGAGAMMIFWGKKDNDALSQCAPNCSQESVDHIRTLYTAADISIGAGVAALGVATVLFATSRPSDERPQTAKGYRFDVSPTRSGGAFASVSGAF